MKAVVITIEGRAIVTDVQGYDDLTKIVGGYIEAVALKCPHPHTAYINEEGKMEGLSPNVLATDLTHLMPGDFIVGQMVILGAPDNEGDDTPIPTEVADWLLDRVGIIEKAHLGIGAPSIDILRGGI